MNEFDNRIKQNEFTDEQIQKMNEHAKLYSFAPNKKEFLKNISAYEQKLVLLNSINPYEVLMYLDELDLKRTRILLDNLTYDEVKSMLLLFSSEDKKRFYATFSDLELVNQFIVQDKNADEYIQNLNFERKVELIDSSDSKTKEATDRVYSSMSYEQREEVANKITDSDAISVLSTNDTYNDDSKVADYLEDSNINISDIKIENTDNKLSVEIEEKIEEIAEHNEKASEYEELFNAPENQEYLDRNEKIAEHNEKAKEYEELFNAPENQEYLDRNEKIAEHNEKASEYEELFNAPENQEYLDRNEQIAEHNEKASEYEELFNAPENQEYLDRNEQIAEHNEKRLENFHQVKQKCELEEIRQIQQQIINLQSVVEQKNNQEEVQKTL